MDDCYSLGPLLKHNPRVPRLPDLTLSPTSKFLGLWNPASLSAPLPTWTSLHRLQPLPTILPSIHQLHPASPRGSSLIALSHTLGLPAGKVSACPLGPVFRPQPPPQVTIRPPPSRLRSCSSRGLPLFARTFCSSRTNKVSDAGICST